MKRMIRLVTYMVLLTITNSGDVFASWQSGLETHFDIVETFDELQPWRPTATGFINDPAQMPKKLDGSASRWEFYTVDDAVPISDWIGDHGEYTFSGGKSLCINYRNLDPDAPAGQIVGYGPSRLATYFGDGITGKSGYKTIHLFYMLKVASGFFVRNAGNTGWAYTDGYLKTIEICSGFLGVRDWGTVADKTYACSNTQFLEEYGGNDSVINLTGGGSSYPNNIFFRDNMFTSNLTDNCLDYDGHYYNHDDTNITNQLLGNQWIGVEIIADIGTVGVSDGSMTIKTYTSNGVLIGQTTFTNQPRLVMFDHYYNKLTIGGNKSFGQSHDYLQDLYQPSIENRLYYDDVIIDDEEIAPTYFTLLAGTPTYDPPAVIAPSDFSTTSTSTEIKGTYAVDPDLPDQSVIVTWTLGANSGFCVAALGVFSATVTGLEVGSDNVVFEITDSASATASDTVVVTRTAAPSGNVIFTGSMSGGCYR